MATASGNEFDLTERDRIRWALIDYMKAHKIGVPTLAERIKKSHPREMEIPWKTLQRFLAGLRTRDMALMICKAFAEKLPNKPTAFHALGEALHAIYKQPLDFGIERFCNLVHEDMLTSHFSISAPLNGYALVTEDNEDQHILDGVIVATAANAHLIVLRDRLLMTPRYVMVSGEDAHIYEFSPLKHPDQCPLVIDAKLSLHA